ncbi:4-nitrophenylphosphatase [Malassezia cuniculi]|uniref:4-nitrophenylphosphatase n=1 Tax=Malassezia cuniculi TaxID=948313 RepID=A0AAF0F0G1_9BASI|nr:4-nitrophenylphosphatase [Malassezia cuniculi]
MTTTSGATATKAPRGSYTFLREAADIEQLVDRYDNFLFDCDGVIWSGGVALPGVVSVLNKLRARGKHILFVTNNASKSRRILLDMFKRFGIDATLEEVYSSAFATALYIKNVLHMPTDRKVFVMGMQGLEEELQLAGYTTLGGTAPETVKIEGTDFAPLLVDGELDHSVGAVVCGIDTSLTYVKMARAFRYLVRPGATGEVRAGEVGGGCHFVCTNSDATFPSKEYTWPGAGAVWAGLREAARREPVLIGKPNQPMIDTIFADGSLNRARTIMVGDRLNTDIAFGQRGGVDTLLVLTGIASEEDVHAEDAPAVPTYIVNGLGDLDVLP